MKSQVEVEQCRCRSGRLAATSFTPIGTLNGRSLSRPFAPFHIGAAVALAAVLCSGCATQKRLFPIVEVAPGIYQGHKPWTQSDFDALRSKGIKTILSVQQLPWDIWPERFQARRNGLNYTNVPIMASPLRPTEKRVRQAVLALSDPSLQPVFIHCMLGEDRNSFIVGLYRVYFLGWQPGDAWQAMLQSGFHVRPTLRGFDTYFWAHTQTPEWAKAAGSAQARATEDTRHRSKQPGRIPAPAEQEAAATAPNRD